jgi:hypothetical protein
MHRETDHKKNQTTIYHRRIKKYKLVVNIVHMTSPQQLKIMHSLYGY